MVEVPAVALGLKPFLDRVDFLSIGTNDLVQYIFAASREDSHLEEYCLAHHPVILGLIRAVARRLRTPRTSRFRFVVKSLPIRRWRLCSSGWASARCPCTRPRSAPCGRASGGMPIRRSRDSRDKLCVPQVPHRSSPCSRRRSLNWNANDCVREHGGMNRVGAIAKQELAREATKRLGRNPHEATHQGRHGRVPRRGTRSVRREESARCRTSATELDRNGDGRVSYDEFTAFMGPEPSAVGPDLFERGRDVFARIDADKSGTISRDEWKKFDTAPESGQDFDALDTNHDNEISPDEWQHNLGSSGVVMHLLKRLDTNQDDSLSNDELQQSPIAPMFSITF